MHDMKKGFYKAIMIQNSQEFYVFAKKPNCQELITYPIWICYKKNNNSHPTHLTKTNKV